MKRFVYLIILTASIFSLAQAPKAVAPGSLSQAMRTMSSRLITVAAQVNNSGQNANSAVLADQFVEMATAAKGFVPDSISSMPAQEQAASKVQYAQILDSAIQLGQDLAGAFRSSDNAKAGAILNQLAGVRKNGHNKFK